MYHKLDKINLEFMQVYNETLLTAINEKVSDFRCVEYAAALVCDRCPFNFKDSKTVCTCTENPACDGSEVDKEQLVTSSTKLTFEEWQKWFYNVTGIEDTRLSKDILAKKHLFYCDVNYVAGLTESCGYPEFDFENQETSDDYKEIDLVAYRKAKYRKARKAIVRALAENNNMKESEETMKEEAKSTDYIRPTNSADQDNVTATTTDVDNAKSTKTVTEHDFRQFIKYNVELILGEDCEKYEYVTLEKMLEIVNTFMITYKSWMTKFTYNDLDDLDYRNTRLGCRVLNASTGAQIMNIYTNESNFGLKRKFVFKD